MPKVEYLAIKQGLPKKHSLVKRKILRKQLVDSLSTNFLGIGVPANAWYGVEEIQVYFHALISQHCSGNLGMDLAYDFYGYNLADQETVMRRCEKVDLLVMEQQINAMLLENALQLPTYKSEYKFAKVKNWNTKFRQKKAENYKKKRKRQRERGVKPPVGRWLSMDFTLKSMYLKTYKKYIQTDHPIAKHITKDRRKKSTTTFMGYHTIYDHELGSRQVLGVHMLSKFRKPGYKDGWKREGLDYVVKYLVDPIVDKIPIVGITFDGDYYNKKVIQYLEGKNLDYVIRASMTPTISQLIVDAKLDTSLADGEGYEVKNGNTMGTGRKALKTRLVIVKRGQELIPLVLPTYSKLTPEQALLVYEERFGIETAYREVYNYLPKTCSLSPMYRLALYALTCWFFNILLNYYQIVVIFASDKTRWQTSLSRLKMHFDLILAEVLTNKAFEP